MATSRIIIAKQIEKADAARKIPVSQTPDNEQGYEAHDQAIVDDMDMLLWALKQVATTIDLANDYLLLYSNTEAKIVRITPGDIIGTHENGIVRLSTGEVRLGTNPLIVDTIIAAGGNDFGFTGAGDYLFTGSGQSVWQMTGQVEVRGNGGVTIRSDGAGGDVFIGQDSDEVHLGGNTLTVVRVNDQYRLNVSTGPDSTAAVQSVLVWTGNGSEGVPAFATIPSLGLGGPKKVTLTDTITLFIRYFGTLPTFADVGDGEYLLTLFSDTVLLGVRVLGNNAAGVLNSSTGDLTLSIDNSADGENLYPDFGLWNRGNNQYVSPPDVGFGIQCEATDDTAGTTTMIWSNLGNFGSAGFRLILTGW